jgi:lipopolysaccharide heptosyltransferase II
VEKWSDVTFKLPPSSLGGKVRKCGVSLVCLVGAGVFAVSRRLTRQRRFTAPEKILIIRRGGLGDALMMTPLLQGLREHFPDARLAVLISRQGVVALKGNPCVDRIFEVPSSRAGWWQLLRILRSERFDTAFILHRVFVPSLFAVAAGIPQRFGFYWKGNGFALTAGVRFSPARSQLVQINDLMGLVGKPSPEPRPRFYLDTSVVKKARNTLLGWGYDCSRPLIGIHPGGCETAGSSEPPRRWLPERFGHLADVLAERDGAQILLLQGPGDEPFTRATLSSMATQPLRVVAGVDLPTFAGLVRFCDIVVANDSAPMHIAATQGVRVVAIFGPSHPAYNPPAGDGHKVIWAGVSCSPCYNPDERGLSNRFHGKKTFQCWLGTHECMKAVTVEDVYTAVKERLNALKGLPK